MSYRSLIRSPYVARLLIGTLVGRLPSGMAILAIPLVMRQAGAPFSLVGVVAGTFAVATAVGGPILGRMVDNKGQPRVLFPAALAAALGFVLIGLAPMSTPATVAGAVLAGAATPPLEPCLRVLWPQIAGAANLERAYAVDSGSQELIYVGAPLLVTAAAAAASPSWALYLAAALGLLGVMTVGTSAPSRDYRAPARQANWLGPLRNGGLRVLYTGLIGTGVAIGALNVLVVAYTEDRHVWGGAGGLLAINAAGAIIGAFAYGLINWRRPLEQRVQAFALGMVVGYGALAFLPAPPAMIPIMLLAGLFLAPMLTVSFVLVERLAPPGTTTEAFAWLITVFTTGMAIGAAVVGLLLERSSPTRAALCAVAATAATTAIFLLGARSLAAERTPSPEVAPFLA